MLPGLKSGDLLKLEKVVCPGLSGHHAAGNKVILV